VIKVDSQYSASGWSLAHNKNAWLGVIVSEEDVVLRSIPSGIFSVTEQTWFAKICI